MASLCILVFCVAPIFLQPQPVSIFHDRLQEAFFYDLFVWVCASWLICYISSICNWREIAKLGQWLAIILLSLDQLVLFATWKSLAQYENLMSARLWVVPAVTECLFLSVYLALFILPALIKQGKMSLTGLGTIAIIIPWMIGKGVIIMGSQLLHGALL
jgi:hypothetical protein